MANKDDDDAVAAAIMHLYNYKIITEGTENVIEMYLHKLCTTYKQDKRKQ